MELQRQRQLNAPTVLRQTYHHGASLRMYELAPFEAPLLDVGCGSGYFTWWLGQHRGKTLGVDVTESFVQAARDRYGIEAYVMDVVRLDFSTDSFAAVCADNVLEHCSDPVMAFLEIRRVLRPGGVLLALIPPDALNPTDLTLAHVWKPTVEEIGRIATITGFVIERLETWNTWTDFGFVYPPSGDRVTLLAARNPLDKTTIRLEALEDLRAELQASANRHLERERHSKEFRAGQSFQQAKELFAVGQYAASREGFARAIAINPSFKEAYFELGRAWEAEGYLDEAMAQYRWLLERLNRDHAAARLRLACCLMRRKDPELAERELELLRRLNPDVPLPTLADLA